MPSYLNLPAIITSLVLLSVIAISLNTLSIYIIATVKALRKRTSSLLLLNLLVVHFLQGLFVFPLYTGKKIKIEDFETAQFFANGFRLTYMLTFYGTCLGILCIAIDRFLATYLLTKYKVIVTRKRVSIALACLWIYIILLCLIPFIDVEGPKYKTKFDRETNSTITEVKRKFYIYKQQPQWMLFMLIANTAIPYLIIIACYVYIILRLQRIGAFNADRKQRTQSAIQLSNLKGNTIELKRKDLEKHKQVTKLTLILTFLYGLFWTPSIIYYPLLGYCPSCFPEDYDDSKLEQHVGYIIKYLAYLDAAAAPLVYCFMHKEFQNSLEKLHSKIFNKPQPLKQQSSTGESTELL